MTSRWENQKRSVVAAAQRMAALGLVAGTSGNVSLRIPSGDSIDLMAVTPSGRPYDSLKADDIVIVDQDIEPVEGDLVPSSESILHSEIYRRRPDVGSVVHTHSVFASVAAVTVEEVPPIIDEMVVTVGGGIKVSSYAFPGSQELADSVCDALGDRNAAIIRHHGAVGVGRDLGRGTRRLRDHREGRTDLRLCVHARRGEGAAQGDCRSRAGDLCDEKAGSRRRLGDSQVNGVSDRW